MVIEKPIQTNLRYLSLNFISLHSTSLNDTKFKASCKADALPISSSVIQPEETDDVTNFDIRDNHDGSYVDEPEVTEDIAGLAKPSSNDLSKADVIYTFILYRCR
jgi:hypothetical protein